MSSNVWETVREVIKELPAVLSSLSGNPIGLIGLVVVLLSGLAVLLIPKNQPKYRFLAFTLLLLSAILLVQSLLVFLPLANRHGVGSKSSRPSGTSDVDVAGTQHIVVHQSGTNATLTGEDIVIVTNEMMGAVKGSAEADFNSDTGEGPSSPCAPFSFRVYNMTNSPIEVRFGVFATDNQGQIGIGPGERYSVDLVDPDNYYVVDPELRWYHKFQVVDCSKIEKSSDPKN
jgi:hypothetical protein